RSSQLLRVARVLPAGKRIRPNVAVGLVDYEAQLVVLQRGLVRRVLLRDVIGYLPAPGLAPFLLELLHRALPQNRLFARTEWRQRFLRHAGRGRYAARDHLVVALDAELEHVRNRVGLLRVDRPGLE